MRGGEVRGLILVCFLAFFLGRVISHTSNKSVEAPQQLSAATETLSAASVPPPVSVKIDHDPGIVALGKEIFARAEAQYSSKSTYFDVWGSGYPDAAAALFLPEQVWDSLPEEKRDALAVLVQSEIPNIKSNPDKFITFAKHTPLYERLRTNVANIADGRYVIMTTFHDRGQWIKRGTVAEGE